jgi:hypothetical protein
MSDYIDSVQITNGEEYDLKDELAVHVNELLDRVYPIGSIYMSIQATDPCTIFGGTWRSWGSGRVPIGVNTSDSDFNIPNKAGGGKTKSYTPSGSVNNHVLTVAEMPSHTHAQNSHNHTQNAHNHIQEPHKHFQDSHSHSVRSGKLIVTANDVPGNDNSGSYMSGEGLRYPYLNQGESFSAQRVTEGAVPDIFHTTAVNDPAVATNNAATATNQNTGGGGGHNHGFTGTAANINVVQPYITCYMWVREA